jgi:hypothetical protein
MLEERFSKLQSVSYGDYFLVRHKPGDCLPSCFPAAIQNHGNTNAFAAKTARKYSSGHPAKTVLGLPKKSRRKMRPLLYVIL